MKHSILALACLGFTLADTSAPELPPVCAKAEYEAILTRFIALHKAELAILNTVNDKASADAAAARLTPLYGELMPIMEGGKLRRAAEVLGMDALNPYIAEITKTEAPVRERREAIEKEQFYGSTALDDAYDIIRRPFLKKNPEARRAALDAYLTEFNSLNQQMLDIVTAISDKAQADAAVAELYRLFRATDDLQDKIIPFAYKPDDALAPVEEKHGPIMQAHREQFAKQAERLRAVNCYGSKELKAFFKNPRRF